MLTLASCSAPQSPASTPTPTPAFQTTGYADSTATTTAQLAASAQAMTEVGVDGVSLTSDGAGISAPDAGALQLLAEAHSKHLRASLLVSNWSNTINDFSEPLAEKMFDSPANIHSVVAALVREVDKHHWDGITIDLEALNDWGDQSHLGDDNPGLDSFVTHLRAALGSHTLSICLTATTGSYSDLGYDLHTLAGHVDYIALMAYDEHGPGWSAAGPVGGMPWVKKSVASLMKSVPASKIQLGVGEYGYSWPTHGTGTTYSDPDMRAFVKSHSANAVWSSTQQEWYATFSDGEKVWWSDARSYRARVALAHSLHLGGVAVWSLGEGDPL
jgi:spore germination protein YaaH